MQQNNLDYVLRTKEGGQEQSPLALNINVMLALGMDNRLPLYKSGLILIFLFLVGNEGARTIGHITIAEDFFQKARTIASAIFDITDHNVV